VALVCLFVCLLFGGVSKAGEIRTLPKTSLPVAVLVSLSTCLCVCLFGWFLNLVVEFCQWKLKIAESLVASCFAQGSG
jgi:hypothetical protein